MSQGLDLAILGGEVVIGDDLRRVDLGVAGTQIALVTAPGLMPPATRTIDAAGLVVFPGGIDPHVHTRWPFLDATTVDSFFDSTRAAAFGGTTTIIDSVIRRSPQTAMDAITGRRADADPDVSLDYALHCAVGDPEDFDADGIVAAVASGVLGFKLYLAYRARRIMSDDGVIVRVMEQAARLGAIVKVHAENGAVADANVARLYAESKTAAMWFPRSKPDWVEAEAISRAIFFAAQTGASLYVVHVSSAAGLHEIARARLRGVSVFAETCPQYLVLDDSVYSRVDGQRFICSPPIRTPADSAALWEGIASAAIDTIGSDHCVFTTSQKDLHRDDFARVPNGLPGIETRLPLLYSGGLQRGIPAARIAAVTSTNAARIFGLSPAKGSITPGADADLAIVDPSVRRTITSADLHMGADWTPYEGLSVSGWPVVTVARGRVLVDADGFHGARGSGNYLKAAHAGNGPGGEAWSRVRERI